MGGGWRSYCLSEHKKTSASGDTTPSCKTNEQIASDDPFGFMDCLPLHSSV